jgi:Bacterial PH domain
MQWRIKPVLPVTKGMGAVAVVVLAVAFAGRDPVRWALAFVVGALLAIWALRDLIAPVRLAADAGGITVITGFARRRHLPWAQIERVRVDVSSRRGLRSELLELDAGESIFLFSAHELGVLPEEVATALAALRTSTGQP